MRVTYFTIQVIYVIYVIATVIFKIGLHIYICILDLLFPEPSLPHGMRSSHKQLVASVLHSDGTPVRVSHTDISHYILRLLQFFIYLTITSSMVARWLPLLYYLATAVCDRLPTAISIYILVTLIVYFIYTPY